MAYENLERFEARQSEDEVKTDLELTCTDCGEIVCDVEHGDSLATLARTTDDHVCPPLDQEHEDPGDTYTGPTFREYDE